MTPRSQIERQWTHRDLDCAVVAQSTGHRCGYVRVPEGHPWHGLDYNDPVPAPLDISEKPIGVAMEDHGVIPTALANEDSMQTLVMQVAVHGGLTFAGKGINGLGKGWWFGFDCAHAGDRRDPELMDERSREIWSGLDWPDEHMWTTSEVAAECERLAEQIANADPVREDLG